jgi:hypothetical protein
MGENHISVVLVEGAGVTLGLAERQGDLLDEVTRFCDEAVAADSVYGLLHRGRDRLFPDEMFADLFTGRGRRSVPPSIVACVIVLQKLGGLSDREACERFTYDARWRYACGVGGWEQGPAGFAHTVLVDFRARLRASEDPERIKRVSVEMAAEAGLLGVKRALDSAPLFDAVATQDTVTLVRSAIRGLLRACDADLEAEVRAVLRRDDDYAAAGKPPCDWDDPEARALLVDELVRDGLAALSLLEERELSVPVAEAAELLATVIGQDIEQRDDGRFAIARQVASDRVISTVDPDARHGHKTASRRYDGYKGHAAVDPDSEIVTATTVTAANVADAEATEVLLAEFASARTDTAKPTADDVAADDVAADDVAAGGEDGEADGGEADATGERDDDGVGGRQPAGPTVYGDAAYGSGDNLERLDGLDATAMVKVPPPSAPGGRYAKDAFTIDLGAGTVTCPGEQTAAIRFRDDGSGTANFGGACRACPLRQRCTTSPSGRAIRISRHEQRLAEARARQKDPAWQADYRANRPKVERKLAHLVRRWHGGRRARMRGLQRVSQDWGLNAAAHNLARLATLGVRNTAGRWQVMPA